MRKAIVVLLVAIVFAAYFWNLDTGEMKDPEAVIRNSVTDLKNKVNSDVNELADTGSAIEARFEKRANDPNQVNGR